MFALFEITNKGSSWIGTLVIAVISNFASMRWGLLLIFFFFAIPIPLLINKVNINQGSKQTRRSTIPYHVQTSPRRKSSIARFIDDKLSIPMVPK